MFQVDEMGCIGKKVSFFQDDYFTCVPQSPFDLLMSVAVPKAAIVLQGIVLSKFTNTWDDGLHTEKSGCLCTYAQAVPRWYKMLRSF